METSTKLRLSLLSLSERSPIHASLAAELRNEVVIASHRAYLHGDRDAERDLQSLLFECYKAHFTIPIRRDILTLLRQVDVAGAIEFAEDTWIANEQARAEEYVSSVEPSSSISASIIQLIANHRASTHPIFDFLAENASQDAFFSFFRSDYALNVGFFDFVALAAVGLDGKPKQEVTGNLWDESGRGDATRAHTQLFHEIVTSLDPGFRSDNLYDGATAEALTGHNLFNFLARRRDHYYKFLGCLGATELLDPPQYAKLLKGALRLKLHEQCALEYYEEHATLDLEHGAGWLQHVIEPLAVNEADVHDVLVGVAMRLNTSCAYYSALLRTIQDE